MKKSKGLENFEWDKEGTKRIRRAMQTSRKVKITINIDSDSLELVRKRSAGTGVPYQRLINQILRSALKESNNNESRLDRLEREIDRLKKKVA